MGYDVFYDFAFTTCILSKKNEARVERRNHPVGMLFSLYFYHFKIKKHLFMRCFQTIKQVKS